LDNSLLNVIRIVNYIDAHLEVVLNDYTSNFSYENEHFYDEIVHKDGNSSIEYWVPTI